MLDLDIAIESREEGGIWDDGRWKEKRNQGMT
jgi:hypothetical protein